MTNKPEDAYSEIKEIMIKHIHDNIELFKGKCIDLREVTVNRRYSETLIDITKKEINNLCQFNSYDIFDFILRNSELQEISGSFKDDNIIDVMLSIIKKDIFNYVRDNIYTWISDIKADDDIDFTSISQDFEDKGIKQGQI